LLIYLPLIGGGVGMVVGQQMLASKDREETRRLAIFSQVLQSHVCLLALIAALILMTIYSQTRMAHTSGLPTPLFFAIGLAGVVSFHCGGQIGIFSGLGHQIYSVILNGASSFTTLLVLWLGFKGGLGPWAMPLATAAGIVVLVPAARVLQLRLMPGLPYLSWNRAADFWSRLKILLPAAANWLQSQTVIMLLFTVDLLLMGFIFGPGAAAVYSIISRVTAMSRQMINTLCDSMWPNLAAEHDPQRKIDLMRKVDRLNAWITGGWFGAFNPFSVGL
jgi:O-antigen/teichoic acid export membrane protein